MAGTVFADAAARYVSLIGLFLFGVRLVLDKFRREYCNDHKKPGRLKLMIKPHLRHGELLMKLFNIRKEAVQLARIASAVSVEKHRGERSCYLR